MSIELFSPGERPELFAEPSIFLSASVPDRKQWLAGSRPERIRAALVELCRFAFTRNYNLVFGGHPAISPMVLAAAQRFIADEARSDEDGKPTRRKRVIIFQSAFFERVIPRATIELAEKKEGHMLWTRVVADEHGEPSKELSLTEMRRVMVQCPRLAAAVLIGGMEGIFEEAELFRQHNSGRPCYPIGSTGSAALRVLERDGYVPPGGAVRAAEASSPRAVTHELLEHEASYPRVFRALFDELRSLESRP